MDPRPYIDVLNNLVLYKPVAPKAGGGKIKVGGEAKGGKRGEVGSDRVALVAVKNNFLVTISE